MADANGDSYSAKQGESGSTETENYVMVAQLID